MPTVTPTGPFLALVFLAGCSSPITEVNPPMRPGGPNWEAVDKSVQRVKDREQTKPHLVETERSETHEFPQMSEEDYASVLDAARSDVRKANPKMSDSAVETEATKRADTAKAQYEHTLAHNASSSYELKP